MVLFVRKVVLQWSFGGTQFTEELLRTIPLRPLGIITRHTSILRRRSRRDLVYHPVSFISHIRLTMICLGRIWKVII